MAQNTTSKDSRDDQSINYQFRVELRQINRLHDFDTRENFKFLLGGSLDRSELRLTRMYGSVAGEPCRVFGFFGMYGQPGSMRPAPKVPVPTAPVKSTSPNEWTYFDNRGEDVDLEDLDVLQYRFRTETKEHSRTFDRKRSTSIKNCWVYVFQAHDPPGKTARLLYELKYDGAGNFQCMDPEQLAVSKIAWITSRATQSTAELPPREIKDATPAQSTLHLDMFVFEGEVRFLAQYFFYLTPWQLPWDAIEKIREAPLSRATRLGDDFHTDVFTGDDPSAAVPLLKKPKPVPGSPSRLASSAQQPSAKSHEKCSYLLHLLNPFDEAIHRSDDLAAAISRLEREFPNASSDEKYALAKAVELFTMNSPPQRELVEKGLTEYLYPNEENIERLWQVVLLLTEELVCWIGHDQVHRSRPLWFRRSSGGYPTYTLTGEPPSNPFAQATWYYWTASKPIQLELTRLINSVTLHLPKTPAGQVWLDRNLENTLKRERDYLERRTAQNDRETHATPSGGLDFLFYANSTIGKQLATELKYTHTIYASSWVRLANQNALVKVTQWFDKRGIPLALVDHPLGIREIPHPETGEAMSILDKETTGRVDKLALANKGLGILRSTIGLFESLYALRRSRDQRTWFTASASFSTWLGACRDIEESWEVVRTGNAANLRAFCPLALYSGTVAVVNSLDGLMKSHDGGQATGRGVQLISALVSLGGVFATGGAAIVVYAISLVLQFAGKWIAFEYETTNQFLRECEFGEKSAIPFQDISLGGRAVNPYRQLSQANRWSYEVQRKEMEKLMHGFDFVLEVEDWSRVVHGGVHALPPDKRYRLAQLRAVALSRGEGAMLAESRSDIVPPDARPCVYLVLSFRYPHCLAAAWTCGIDLKVRSTGMGTVTQTRSSLSSDQLRTWDPKGNRRALGITQDGSLKILLAELDPAVYAGRLSSEELVMTGKVFVTNLVTRQTLFTYEIEDSAWAWTRGEGPTLNSKYNDQAYLQQMRSNQS